MQSLGLLSLGLLAFPAAVWSASDLSALLDGKSTAYEERSRASHLVAGSLSSDEVDALLAFLARKPGEDVVSIAQLATLKNNAADALLKQPELPSKLGEVFKQTFADKDQGTAWRDYIVQKIPELARRLSGPEQMGATDFLRARVEDTEHIYAGTALLGLQRLHDAGIVSADEIAKASVQILDGPNYVAASQNTALQILAKHQPEVARGRARAIVANRESVVMAKVAAIATLGSVGETQDVPILDLYSMSPDLRLRNSAQAALAKLKPER